MLLSYGIAFACRCQKAIHRRARHWSAVCGHPVGDSANRESFRVECLSDSLPQLSSQALRLLADGLGQIRNRAISLVSPSPQTTSGSPSASVSSRRPVTAASRPSRPSRSAATIRIGVRVGRARKISTNLSQDGSEYCLERVKRQRQPIHPPQNDIAEP